MGGFASKKVEKLTDAQRKLVEENHNLIYKVLYDKGFNIEEWYDVAAIALCNAAALYKPEKDIKFATYAYTSIYFSICRQMDLNKAQHRIPDSVLFSYNKMVPGDEYERSYADFLPGSGSFEDDIIDVERFKKGLEKLNNRDREIILLLADGHTYKSVGEKFGLSRESIRQILNKYAKAVDFKRTRKRQYNRSVALT